MSPTEKDCEHLREVVRDGDTMHPFTAGRFVALGWMVCTNPKANGAFSAINRGYELTDAGRKVVACNE